jgi:branched-chain amino acid transport system permease protein
VELFVATTVFGLYIGSAYAIAASGLVLTYATTRVFNLAHGATSMVMAHLYWQLHIDAGLPTLPAVLLVVGVIAPLFGLVLERLMRGLGEAPVSVMLVVTIALFMALVGLATQVWPNTVVRSVEFFFGYRSVDLLGARIGYHYLLTIALAGIVAAALYVLLNRTRVGIAMRACVDNPELLEVFGTEARRVSQLSWMIGSSLAALGGVLLAAYTGLDYYSLTFLVIAAFAAAMLGGLRSLPLTYVGSLLLGLGSAYIASYLAVSPYVQVGLQTSLPTFLLFVVLLFVPQVRLRVGQVKGIVSARIPTARRSVQASVVVLGAGVLLVSLLDGAQLQDLGIAVAYGIVMLSMVLLTGYGGYLSLAQFTFFGIGAATVAKADTTSVGAVVLAVLLSALAGALVALPVLRLTGLYLALATLAFGQLMDRLVFSASFVFDANGSLPVQRVSPFGIDLADDRVYVVAMLAVFLVLGVVLLGVRRGPVGRVLLALRDSPQAAATLGLGQGWIRVAVFSVAAGVAGLAGALTAGLEQIAAPGSFSTIASLPAVLVAVVAGVTTVSGALVGGVLLMYTLTSTGSTQGLVFLVLAAGAVLLARDPNGLVNLLFTRGRALIRRVPVPSGRAPAVEEVAGRGVA